MNTEQDSWAYLHLGVLFHEEAKVQGCELAFCPGAYSQDAELFCVMLTAARAAFGFPIPYKPFPFEYEV